MAAKQLDLPDLSPAQRQIMEIVWELGEVSAREVRRVLARTRPVARNTVRTLLERMEEKVCIYTDNNTPILPPIPPGYRPICEDVPDRRTIIRAMPRVARGVPYVYEEFRDDFDFTIEKLADIIDPPRFFPLIGPAQLHHCHFKCTVYYTETIQSSYPFSFKCTRRRTEVVYIDRDHLHQCVPSPETRQSVTRDLTTRP